MLRTAAIILSATLIPAAVIAADGGGQYAIRGIGSYSCKTVQKHFADESEAVRNEAQQIYTAWISGYLSAINRSSDDTFDSFPAAYDLPVLMLALGQCEKTPDLMFEQIVGNLVATFHPMRVVGQSPVVAGDGGQLALRAETIRNVQQKLIDLGLLKGPADGKFGPASQGALAEFQKQHPGSGEAGVLDLAAMVGVLASPDGSPE